MLLNEFLKEHTWCNQIPLSQKRRLPSSNRRKLAALRASLKKQAAQIQKISAQIGVTKSAPQVLVNNP